MTASQSIASSADEDWDADLPTPAAMLAYARTLTGDWDRADEAVQNTWLHYCRRKRKEPPLHSPRAWIYRVLRNKAFDELRWVVRERKRAEPGADESLESYGTQVDPLRNLRLQEDLAWLLGRIRALPPAQQEVITLTAQGVTVDEMAVIMFRDDSVPPEKRKQRLYRARWEAMKYLRRQGRLR